jgi:hypothetical protein
MAALQDHVIPHDKQPKDDLGIIFGMMEAIGREAFTPLAVLANCEAGLYIVEGHKSAVACHERSRQRNRLDAILPVIIPSVPFDCR